MDGQQLARFVSLLAEQSWETLSAGQGACLKFLQEAAEFACRLSPNEIVAVASPATFVSLQRVCVNSIGHEDAQSMGSLHRLVQAILAIYCKKPSYHPRMASISEMASTRLPPFSFTDAVGTDYFEAMLGCLTGVHRSPIDTIYANITLLVWSYFTFNAVLSHLNS